MTKTVLVTDYAWPDLTIERDILAREADARLLTAETGDEAELLRLAKTHPIDGILVNWRPISFELLTAVRETCRVIGRYGVGVDNIPVGAATEMGVVVTNVPDYCMDETADHTMSLLLACARNLLPLAADTRTGGWDIHVSGRPFVRLREQTLGVVGFGRIGRAVAQRAMAFGLRVIAYTPRLTAGDVPAGVEAVQDLSFLLRHSDYVSLHAPATAETENLIDAAALAEMKASAYLLNTARGALVDEGALYEALTAGEIRGAGLDVLREEAADTDNPLLALDNVIVTPHAAFYSPAAIRELQTKAVTNVAAVLNGRRPAYVVNPAVYD